MKLSKEFINGAIIFLGIAIYFFLMQLLGLSGNLYLRILNVFIVYYGIYRTLQSNMNEGELSYINNLVSAGLTAIIGVILSTIGLVLYIYANGGQSYLNNLSSGYLFGGKPTVTEFVFGILFEGLASAIIIVFISMQYWRAKTSTAD